MFVNIACFGGGVFVCVCVFEGDGLGCFELESEMYVPRAHLGKGALRPHYYYYVSTPWCMSLSFGQTKCHKMDERVFGGGVQF